MTEAEPDDLTLLRSHVGGDPTAFGELVTRHRHRLWSVAYRTLQDAHEAEDAVQDGLIKAHRAAPGFRGDAAVSTWLHRIVLNASLDRLRRRKATPADDPSLLERRPAPDDISPLYARMDVERALRTLPVDQRLAIVLTDIEGMSVAQAARALEIPVGTLKSRNSRGKAAMRRVLLDGGNQNGSGPVRGVSD